MRSLPRPVLWAALVLTVTAVCAVVAFPVWHVQPFRPQTTGGMRWSYLLRREGPVLTAAGVAVVVVLGVPLWIGTRRRWARAAIAALVSTTVLAAWLVRQNHYEWMFAPLPDVQYARAQEASFVTDEDMVMGVTLGGASTAFPVRQLAYHHLVNTEVGGTAVVATY